jgi:hypothetical protein
MLADGCTKPYSGTATEENMKRIGMVRSRDFRNLEESRGLELS